MRFLGRSFLFVLCLFSLFSVSPAQGILLDSFEDLSGWKPIVSDGVTLAIKNSPGDVGACMALEYVFHGGAGYAIAQRDLPVVLPRNYRFTFCLRGESPDNNFEFKLLDSLGNVFWIKKLNVVYPREWRAMTVKKKHLSFAWGPSEGGELTRVAKVEFVVSAGNGGRGTVYIDEFRFEPLPDSVRRTNPPLVSYSSLGPGARPQVDAQGDFVASWTSAPRGSDEWLAIDFRSERELGGLVLDWNGKNFATAYRVQYSDNGKTWLDGYAVMNGNGGRDYIPLPEFSARYLRLSLRASTRTTGFAIRRIEFKPPEFTSTPNALFAAIAADARQGLYPAYCAGQQSYWTVVGASGDSKEALVDETGAIEIEKGGVRLEPFVHLKRGLLTRNDGTLRQSLDRGYLPIVTVEREYPEFRLSVRAFAAGEGGKSVLLATYRLKNELDIPLNVTLFVAVRGFQVVPPWQDLNMVGGVTRVESLQEEGGVLRVNGERRVFPLSAANGFGAAEFDQGDITDYLSRGTLPISRNVWDHAGYASGAYRFDAELPPNGDAEYSFAVPFYTGAFDRPPMMTTAQATTFVDGFMERTRSSWESKLGGIDLHLPGSGNTIANVLKSNLAYISINRDGPAIQPGSRTYKRAWIRDGSLTSTALLQTGNAAEVRDYLDWYARYQYPSGKIPCVVDWRGADPVPEHDSHGEFIYAVMQYFRYTHDTLWLREKFENVKKAVRYIQELRRGRKTEEYRRGSPQQRACYGLVPESISHEGYSAKPMHSYWDDFFVLRGLKDASEMAHVLQETEIGKEFSDERDDFQSCLYASMNLAMATMNIDYIPGCVELGDFDATSTTIGILPCGELGNIPEPQLHRTFDKYYEFFLDRRRGQKDWVNYTPYEVRIVGAFVLLRQRTRAHELLKFLLHDQRPAGWNHWAEVVWRDPATPRMIGDMPHTWVGSDFIRSVRSMFVYERERDTSLVVGAGVPQEWIADGKGMEVRHLPTYYGTLDYSASMTGRTVVCRLGGTINPQSVRILLVPPIDSQVLMARVNGREEQILPEQAIEIRHFPATIELLY